MRILYYKADIRSVAVVMLAVVSYAVQWSDLVRHPALYLASLCLAFISCVINHNHQHHPTFVSRGLNRAFSVLISLAVGNPATVVVAMHNLNHHVYNNHPQDLSRASIVGFRFRPLNVLLFPFVMIAQYRRVRSRELREWRTRRRALYHQLTLERMVICPIWIGMLAARPWETLVFLGGPYLYGQWGILAINHIQHVGCDPDSQWNHSRNLVGRWLNWWVFNNGYHTIHHQRPGAHWSRLPQLHRAIRHRIDPDLESRSMLVTLFKMYIRPGHKLDLSPEPRRLEAEGATE